MYAIHMNMLLLTQRYTLKWCKNVVILPHIFVSKSRFAVVKISTFVIIL